MTNKDTRRLGMINEAVDTEEVDSLKPIPRIHGWQLMFLIQYGFDNRDKIMDGFYKFLNSSNPEDDFYHVPGDCELGGIVCGHPVFEDGSGIFTSPVISIEKKERGTTGNKRHDLLYATTASGNHYCFYSDDFSDNMGSMLERMKHRGKLSRWPGRYLERKEWGRHYL